MPAEFIPGATEAERELQYKALLQFAGILDDVVAKNLDINSCHHFATICTKYMKAQNHMFVPTGPPQAEGVGVNITKVAEVLNKLNQKESVVIWVQFSPGKDHFFLASPVVSSKGTLQVKLVQADQGLHLPQEKIMSALDFNQAMTKLMSGGGGANSASKQLFGHENFNAGNGVKIKGAVAGEMKPMFGNGGKPIPSNAMHGVGAGAAIGGAIGLCFTFIQVALDDDPGVTTAAQVEKVTKGALEGAASAAASQLVRNAVGKTIWRASIAGTAVCLVIETSWSLKQYLSDEISGVRFRKNVTAGVLGSAGGVGAAGAVLALATGPVGWVLLGSVAAGVVGGVLGSVAGAELDTLIWDSEEDLASDAYWFFGLDQARGTRPKYSEKQIGNALFAKYNDKRKKDIDAWQKHCISMLHILICVMYKEQLENVQEAVRQIRQQ
eukprot:EG_transcript_10117